MITTEQAGQRGDGAAVGHGSVLDGVVVPSGSADAPRALRKAGRIRLVFAGLASRWMGMSLRLRWSSAMAAAVLIGLGAFFALRPTPQPDFFDDPIEDLFDYTLLTDDFNKLPIEQRMALLKDLVERLKRLSGSESAAMAAFASAIKEQARKQLEENASRLAVDLWDYHAADYAGVPPDMREEFLDQAFVDYMEKMEAIAGEVRDLTPEARLEEARNNAQRDMNAMKERGPIPGKFAGRFFNFMNDGVGGHANPQQRARGQLMVRDMTRRLRGQPLTD